VASEDHAAAVFLPHHPPQPDAIEILCLQIVGHRFHLLLAVGRLTRRRERLLVDVSRVDLHAFTKRLRLQQFGEQDRHRVRFLARCAAGAPDTDGVVRRFGINNGREDRRAEQLEDMRVAEKRGDVDEDDVEELAELVRMDLEVIDVGGIRRRPDHAHPLFDSPRQGRGFVSAELETASVSEVIEEAVEPGGRGDVHGGNRSLLA
jgi:hypothetical protein